MVTEGRKAYLFFTSIKEGVGNYEDDITQAQLNPEKTTNNRQVVTGETKSEVSVDEVGPDLSVLPSPPFEANRVRSRGDIWMRQTLSKGGSLILCYGVLERGKLDIYRNEAVCLLARLLSDRLPH
jgi:hypothetical protein